MLVILANKMLNLKDVIVVLCLPLVSSSIIDIESEKNKWRTMVQAIDGILDDSIIKNGNSLFVCAQTNLSHAIDSQLFYKSKPNQLLDEVLQVNRNQEKVSLYINVDNQKHPTFGNNSLWICDGFDSFWNFFEIMTCNSTVSNIDSNRYFVIALTIPEENHYETVKRILVKCWRKHVANVVVLVPTQNYTKILLYTYFPYSNEHCEQIEPVVRNFFENSSFNLSVSHFPDKCRNFHQCTMHVAAADDIPYTFLTGYGTNDTPTFDGLDAMIIGEISRRLNFRMKVLPYDGGFQNTKDYNKVNISVAGSNPLRRYYRHTTIPYIYDTMLYVIPPGKPYSSLATLFFPFRMEVWIGVCSSFLLMVLAILVLKFTSKKNYNFVIGCNNDAPLLNLFCLILGGSMTTYHMPRRNFARTILLILLVTTLILRNAYLGNLFNFLQTQKRMEPMYHIQDIHDSDVPIYYLGSRTFVSDSPAIKIRKKQLDLSLDELRGIDLDGPYCQLKNIVDYNNFINFRKPKLLMTKEYIKMYPIVMWVRKSTCLKVTFDRQIAALHSSGLVEHWQKSYTKTVKDPEDRNPKKLKIDQFIGIIEICAVMYALSFFVFIMELMTLKCKRIRTLMDFLTLK